MYPSARTVNRPNLPSPIPPFLRIQTIIENLQWIVCLMLLMSSSPSILKIVVLNLLSANVQFMWTLVHFWSILKAILWTSIPWCWRGCPFWVLGRLLRREACTARVPCRPWSRVQTDARPFLSAQRVPCPIRHPAERMEEILIEILLLFLLTNLNLIL